MFRVVVQSRKLYMFYCFIFYYYFVLFAFENCSIYLGNKIYYELKNGNIVPKQRLT